MIDHSIPLMAKGIDGLQMLDDGNKLAQLWQGQKVNAEMGRIYKESGGDQDEMMKLGQNSALARLVMPQLQAQQTAQQKALLDQQKTQADIGNTNAQALERTANAGGANQKTLINRQRAISSAMAAAMSGDPKATNFMLEHGKLGRILDDSSYTQAKQFLAENANNPEAISSLVKSLGVAAAEKPEQYIQPDANTVADNATSIQNNELTNQTSITNNQNTVNGQKYSVDQNVQLGQNRIEQDDRKLTYQKYIDQNKPLDYFTAPDGTRYAVYPGGKGIPITDIQGNQVKANTKNSPSKLSDNALKQVNEASTQLAQSNQSYKKIGSLVNDLKSGKLKLSAGNIMAAKGRMAIGQSTPNDLAVNEFQTALNQAANDVLMMAKGTQTEGDAQRAVATITANPPRDNNAAMQSLNTLAGIQRNTIETLNGNINTVYDNYGIARPGVDKPKPPAPKPSNTGAPPLTNVQQQGFQSLIQKHTK